MYHGAKSDYRGFDRYDFEVDGCATIVVAPRQVAPIRPWMWRAEFFDHEPQADVALLNLGFHLTFIEVHNTFGSPWAMDRWDSYYSLLTGEYGLHEKAALEGLSRGGLYCYNWAARHPERVACIYADAGVMDFKSWPAGLGVGDGSPTEWQKLLGDYGFASEEEALAYRGNPVDNLQPLAQAGIPLLHVYGDTDTAVPPVDNALVVRERYAQLGGHVEMICKPGVGHHPHALVDPTPIVEFVLRAYGLTPES